MENTKLLIRPRLVKDALSSVLVTAGFKKETKSERGSESQAMEGEPGHL